MGTLHQLLAVKKDTAQRANEISAETKKALGAKHLFNGSIRSYKAFREDDDSFRMADEHEQLSYTVGEKLKWFAKQFGRHIDVEYQIDKSNDQARATLKCADLLIPDAPATFLLDLITFLERTRKVYATMPVLDPKYDWEPDVTKGAGVYRTKTPEETFRTKKVLQHKILVDPTDKHPAQVEKWTEDIQVGVYVKKLWSGAVTAAQKAELLARIDKLIESAKKALSEANNVDHTNEKIADDIFEYIHGDLPTEGVLRD